MASKRGRRTKIDDEQLIAVLLDTLEQGASIAHACAMAGVSQRAVMNWRSLGEKAKRPSKYTRFLDAFDKAVALGAVNCLRVVDDIMIDPDTPAQVRLRAATWRLEHRFPDDYGTGVTIKHTGDPDAPLAAKFEVFDYAVGLRVDGDEDGGDNDTADA